MKEEKLFLILYLSSKYNLPTGPIIDPVTRVELVGEREFVSPGFPPPLSEEKST